MTIIPMLGHLKCSRHWAAPHGHLRICSKQGETQSPGAASGSSSQVLPVQQPWHFGTAFNSSIKIPLGSFCCGKCKEAVTQSQGRSWEPWPGWQSSLCSHPQGETHPKMPPNLFPRGNCCGQSWYSPLDQACHHLPLLHHLQPVPGGTLGVQKKPLTTVSFTSVGLGASCPTAHTQLAKTALGTRWE